LLGLLSGEGCADDLLEGLHVGVVGMEENCQTLSELSDRFLL
jgi:hypothetical protein